MRIGIYGGTFDPVHQGHRVMVEAALERLDRVMVIPCRISPHKVPDAQRPPPTDAEHRWRMLELSLGALNRVELSRIEIDREEISFTWQTLEALRAKYPEDHLVLILGDDQYQVLPTWIRFSEWAESVDYLVFRRPGAMNHSEPILPPGLKIEFHERIPPTVASSEIRERLQRGEKLSSEVLDPKVAEYIRKHGLYQ